MKSLLATDQPPGAADEGTSHSRDIRYWSLFAVPALVYGLTFTVLRQAGEIPYVLACAAAIAACLGSYRLFLLPGQGVIVLWSILYLILSLYDRLPPAWTRYHENYAALRQWSWMITMPIFTTAFALLFATYRRFIVENAYKLAFGLYLLRVGLSAFDPNPEFFADLFLGRFGLYSPNNETAPIILLLFIGMYRDGRFDPRGIAANVGLIAVTTSLGTQLPALAALGLRWVKNYRFWLWIFFAAIIAFLAITPFYFGRLIDIDPNTGVRTLFWRDVQIALVKTWGAGVGYGTEYITNFFGAVGQPTWTITPEDAADRLFVSTHSTFYDITLRLGAVGLGLFVLMMTRLITVVRSPTGAAVSMFVLMNCAVNPAMVAVETQIGMAVMLAWLIIDSSGLIDVGEGSSSVAELPQ